MDHQIKHRVLHRGRIKQIPIYLGKFFRMFILKNDWLVLPMSALIAALVATVVGGAMFSTMEGALMGAMAVTCVCLWNGCFNSIQAVCRERGIVKREHRSGMHVSAYILSHMIYQAFLCLMQTVITILVFGALGVDLPSKGFITPWFRLDYGITIFLTTYAADMLSLMISCIVRDTTTAMTVMPLLLIFELVFSGIMFTLDEGLEKFSKLTVAKWGMTALCSQADYNSLPLVQVWNQLVKFRNYEVSGFTPINEVVQYIQDNGLVNDFCLEAGANSQNLRYTLSSSNIYKCWLMLMLFAFAFAAISMLFLKRIDKDKR